MSRAGRQRLGLLCAVALLLALALWQWRSDQRTAPGTLLALTPAAIQHLGLRLGDAAAQHYERRDGHWWRTDGTALRADDNWLDGLAGTAAADVLRWRPASAFDPARIGLQPPRAVLTLDGQPLEFGEISATGPQTYVRVGARVALISLRYLPRPPQAGALHTD